MGMLGFWEMNGKPKPVAMSISIQSHGIPRHSDPTAPRMASYRTRHSGRIFIYRKPEGNLDQSSRRCAT